MTVISRKIYKARKKYVCNDCCEYITKNQHHVYLFGSKKGKSYSTRLCLACGKGEFQ